MPISRLTVLAVLLGGFLLSPAARAAQAPEVVTWHGNLIHLYDAHHAGYRGSGVKVAVLDGWIDRTHPDFGGRVTSAADCTSGACSTTMGSDSCGQHHGTHVAGTVTSSSYGVAPRATLMPIRVLTTDGSGDCAGNPAAVAAGIHWAVTHGAKVLNLSLGPDIPGQASAIQTAVNQAYASGAVVVFSAGNSGASAAQAYDNALVVAATGASGKLASYSQRGSGVSVAAPGGQPTNANSCTPAICVTSLYPANRYAVAAGTSMAAPHVAGIAALLISAHPGWSPDQVMSRIRGTAHPLAGAGSGRVDAAAALGVKSGTVKPTPAPTRSRPPVIVVRPRTVTPAHTTSPTPRPVVMTPAPKPTPTVAVTPTPTPSPATIAEPEIVPTSEEPIPEPLAALAGMLVGLSAAAVLVLPRFLR